MKLCTFHHAGSLRVGAVVGDEIVDLSEAAPELPRDLVGLLAAGEGALRAAEAAVQRATRRLPLEPAKLAAPILRPPSRSKAP